MIAKAIREYMKENGIKQSFICDKTGMTRHSISSALKGERKLSIEEYARICKALNVPYNYFFEKSKQTA